MPSVLLWACLAENLFLFAAQKNLRIFLSCFFTGRGRDGKRHLLLSACGRRAATSDWRNLKKRLRDLHAEQAGISSFLRWSLLLWDYQPPPTRIRSAQETMRKKASRPRHARMLGAATRGTKKEPTGLFFAACGRPCSFDSSYGLHETATTLDIPSRWDPRANQSPTGALVAVLRTAALFDSRTGQIKNPPSECSRDFYDPYGNRTHVTAVKGPCLNRLTNGPYKYRASLKPPTFIVHYCGRPSPLS